MILHFLLQQNKKNIITEYILRVATFLAFFIAIAIGFLTTLFLPSVFFSTYKNQTIHHQLESMAINKNNGDDPIQTIKNINTMVRIFSGAYSQETPMSSIIKKIISLKNSKIQITAISLVKNTDLSKTVVVRGVSQTRDALTSFNNDLRADSVFTKVDLPLTNLIKDVNTDFTITLTYKDILTK